MTEIIKANYTTTQHANDLLKLLNNYACDPMGGGEELPSATKQQLITKLAQRDGAMSLLAYTDNGEAIGLLNAFEGFSTFAAAPLLNIHDVYVAPSYRGNGIATALFQHAEQLARAGGCCKVTLEVLSGNEAAKQAYATMGYAAYELDKSAGHALFWQKKL